MQLVKSSGLVRPCCMPENLTERAVPNRHDLTVKVCRICGARHFELSVDPGRAFAEGARL